VLRRVGDATAGDDGAGVLWCGPRHADREGCTVVAMLLLVVMVLVCLVGCARHADRECCAVWAMLRLVW
jgi:hypothetical protein